MIDDLLNVAECLFAAGVAEQRFPALVWTIAWRYWGVRFAAGIHGALGGLEASDDQK
jgi:hypothetical protein